MCVCMCAGSYSSEGSFRESIWILGMELRLLRFAPEALLPAEPSPAQDVHSFTNTSQALSLQPLTITRAAWCRGMDPMEGSTEASPPCWICQVPSGNDCHQLYSKFSSHMQILRLYSINLIVLCTNGQKRSSIQGCLNVNKVFVLSFTASILNDVIHG